MWNGTAARLGFALSAVALVSACSDTPPTQPVTPEPETPLFSAAALQSGAPMTLDDQFARLNQDVPGFGGMYRDESGTLTAVMADGGMRLSRVGMVDQLRSQLSASGLRVASNEAINIKSGEYDFLTLRNYKARLGSVFAISGVVFTDVDEVANRVRVGVLDEGAQTRVQAELRRAGVPSEAVLVSLTEPIEQRNHTLRDAIRPTGGGLQIWRLTSPTSASICTLGFNVRSPGTPVQGLVTNSHCTINQGEVNGTLWTQKQLVLPHEPIAMEVHDAPFFACQYAGYRCRYSDAAGGVYLPGVENAHGRIYRTHTMGTTAAATLEIDHANEHFTITDEKAFPLVGDVLNKVGRTSGWTSGPVSQTCIDTGVANTNPPIALLCQDRVVAFSAGGDSGSPAFERIGNTNNVRLVGILWGGSSNTFVISSMSNIRFENPGPRPWTVYPGQTAPR